MNRCTDCKRINPAESIFCHTCGSAKLEPVSDELPFEGPKNGVKLKLYHNGQEIPFDTPLCGDFKPVDLSKK